MTVLDKIISDKKADVKRLYEQYSLEFYKETIKNSHFTYYKFEEALRGDRLSLIAEVKKASPSKGIIRSDFDPVSIAKEFELNKASCLSVLTDEAYFGGKNDYLSSIKQQCTLPILRKDFIIDEIQIYESKAIGADCILVILAVLSCEEAQHFISLAKTLELSVLVEIHSEEDAEKLLRLSDISMIGINNRDLKTFAVDYRNAIHFKKLLGARFKNAIFVAESGYDKKAQLIELREHNIDAVLIGEGLAREKTLIEYFNEN
jgi:indole-3-glycerol phosphate synthase